MAALARPGLLANHVSPLELDGNWKSRYSQATQESRFHRVLLTYQIWNFHDMLGLPYILFVSHCAYMLVFHLGGSISKSMILFLES